MVLLGNMKWLIPIIDDRAPFAQMNDMVLLIINIFLPNSAMLVIT